MDVSISPHLPQFQVIEIEALSIRKNFYHQTGIDAEKKIQGAFHMVKNSENSGSGLNEKRFFGSPDWKIPRKSGTAQKVLPFSRLERPDWFLVFQLHPPGNL